MRYLAFVLVLASGAATTAVAQTSAEEPKLAFSAPPAQAPDLTGWARRTAQVKFVIKNAGDSVFNQAVTRHKLCRADELPCDFTLRYEFAFRTTCVNDADREESCEDGKSYKTRIIRIVGHYVMERGGIRAEGYALATPTESVYRYFLLESDAAWAELSQKTAAAAFAAEDDLFTNLYQVATRIAESDAVGAKPAKPIPRNSSDI